MVKSNKNLNKAQKDAKHQRRQERKAATAKEQANDQKKEIGGPNTSDIPEKEIEKEKTQDQVDSGKEAEKEKEIEKEEPAKEEKEPATKEPEEARQDKEPVKEEETPAPSETTDEEVSEEEEQFDFQELCIAVSKVLRTFPGNKLNCRLRVLVEDRTAIIHQGPKGNVWARLKVNGDHNFYRHALKKILQEHESTAEYFKNVM